jgi:hypothetical protein
MRIFDGKDLPTIADGITPVSPASQKTQAAASGKYYRLFPFSRRRFLA